MPERDHVLVTGAAGFIGRRICKYFVDRQVPVIALVRGERGRRFVNGPSVEWDLRNDNFDERVLARASLIVHAAAYKPTDQTSTAPLRDCLETNVHGTIRLLTAAVDQGVEHVIQVGAGNLHGPGGLPATELDPVELPKHGSSYLLSKLVQMGSAEEFVRGKDLKLTTLLPSSVYGPGMSESSFLVQCITKFRNKQPLTITHAGRFMADYVFVDDISTAAYRAWERSFVGRLNVSTGTSTSSVEVAQMVGHKLGVGTAYMQVEESPGDKDAGFGPLSPILMRSELGLSPLSLDRGLDKLLNSVDLE